MSDALTVYKLENKHYFKNKESMWYIHQQIILILTHKLNQGRLKTQVDEVKDCYQFISKTNFVEVKHINNLFLKKMADFGFCWSILWLLILIILAWPIGGFCAFWYLFLSPFSACIEACSPLIELLEKGLKLPLTCALNLVHQKPLC